MTGSGREDLASIAHDPDAFEAFYRAHVEDIQAFIARRVDDPYLVADLTADVFLAAIDSAHSYRADRGPAAAWLFGVARNVVASHRRRRAREAFADRRISGRALVDDVDLVRLEERIDAQHQARRLYDAMERLSPAERAVLELVALEGLVVADVAGVLGISAVAARVRLHRARRVMQRELTPPVNAAIADLSEERS